MYQHQLLGLQVVLDADDTPLGVIAEILETGANDVFLVRPPQGKDILIPDIDSVVLKIDLETGQVRIRPLPGLLPE
jgi:16S rRNA processing protein RimM